MAALPLLPLQAEFHRDAAPAFIVLACVVSRFRAGAAWDVAAAQGMLGAPA